MANDYNCYTCTGRLGADPEVRYLPDGKCVTNFTLACGETWKGKDGEKKEKTEWVKVVIFGKLAEISGEYLAKGKQVLIAGKLQTRSWDDKDGNKKYTTEVVANQMIMLGGKGEAQTKTEDAGYGGADINDCPF